jgi:hypothetical protein
VLTTGQGFGRQGFGRQGLGLRHLIALVVMAQLADVVTTVHAVTAGHAERNPLTDWVLQRHGALGLLGVKGLAAGVIVVALARIPVRWARSAGLATVTLTTMAALSNARFG